MKVLFINHVSQISGAERSLLGLIRHLPDEGFAPEAALPAGSLFDELAGMGVPVCPVELARLKRRASPVRQLSASLRLGITGRVLAQVARQRGISLVHANSSTAALAGLLAARWAGVPGVWHVRDLVPLGGLGRWLGSLASRVIAISGAVAAEAAAWGVPPDRIVTIANGVDASRFHPDRTARAHLRGELGIPPSAFLVASAGQLVPWKGHHVLLDALGRIRRASPGEDIRCVIAGADLFHDHPDYEMLLRGRAQQPDLSSAVTFLGQRQDMPALYNACDAFVLASKREPFGRALVEAMACGRPVVAFRDSGPAEIVSDGATGLLVPPGDVEALAGALVRLRQESDLARRVGDEARRHAHAEYPEERTAQRVAALYREVMGGNAHRR